MRQTGFIDPGYKPDYKNNIIAVFYLEPSKDFKSAAEAVAGESSIGSWTDLTTLKPATKKRLKATVFDLNVRKKIIKVAYPLDLFELGSIPQLLSSIGGNIFSMKAVKNLRLLDIEFPEKYIRSFQGPAFGIDGVRKVLKNKNKLILGSIIKPKVGLTAKEHAELAYKLWMNGIDLVKDDENLTDMVFNRFKDRVKYTLRLKKEAEQKTGKKKLYSANITAPADEMVERAKFVKKHGGETVMVDIVSVGFDNVQYLRKQKLGLIIHGHRAGHSTFTRNPRHGITMLVVAKLARLAGVDQLHTGTVVGKMDGSEQEVLTINEFLHEDWRNYNALREDWSKMKPTLPIASGGMHPGLVPKLVEILGKDLIVNFGGGIHGHKDGSEAGARACAQVVEAIEKGVKINKYAQEHPELATVLAQWGSVRYKIT